MAETCQHQKLTRITVRDILRREPQAHARTDDELMNEQLARIIGSIKDATGKAVASIDRHGQRIIESITEYETECTLEGGCSIEITQSMTDAWSEEHYSFAFKEANIKIDRTYNFATKKYTSTIKHRHGQNNLMGVKTVKNDEGDIRIEWDKFLTMVKTGSKEQSPSLLRALNSVQAKEAVMLSRERGISIPIIKMA